MGTSYTPLNRRTASAAMAPVNRRRVAAWLYRRKLPDTWNWAQMDRISTGISSRK